MKKGDATKPDDVIDLLRAIRSSQETDNGLIVKSGVAAPRDRVRMQKRIDNFRNRFVASIVADTDDGERRDVYANILGKLYAAAARAYYTNVKSSSAKIASRYADSLLMSLDSVAGVETSGRGAATSTRKATTKAKAAVSADENVGGRTQKPRGVNVPRAARAEPSASSTIREIRESDAESELFNTKWWPQHMHLLWIYAKKGLKTPAIDNLSRPGDDELYVPTSRKILASRMSSPKFPKFPGVGKRVGKAEQEAAMSRLRLMLDVAEMERVPKTVIIDVRDAEGPAKRTPPPGDASTEEEDDFDLKTAIAKLGAWLPHLGTKLSPVCVVVISDHPNDATHAAIALDKGAATVPDAPAFIRTLTDAGALDEEVDEGENGEGALSSAVYFAGLPVVHEDYAPVRWERGYLTGPGEKKPVALSLVSANGPVSTSSVRYHPKDMRVFLKGALAPFPMVPHVSVTDETAVDFIPFLVFGATDHASHVRVIDATKLTMPSGDGKATRTPDTTRSRDLNVALLLAVAMGTHSVLIVTAKQSERMMLELEWMDRVFLRPASGGGGLGPSGPKAAAAAAAAASPSASGARPASQRGSSSSASPHSARGGASPGKAATTVGDEDVAKLSTVEDKVLHDDAADGAHGAGEDGEDGEAHGADGADGASEAPRGKASAGDNGKFEIFGESLCIVKHDNGGAKKCPANMLSAAADHQARLAAKGHDDKLGFLVSTGPCAAGKGKPRHHSATPQNDGSIYIRCAPDATDDALELDYPQVSPAMRIVIRGSGTQEEIAKRVNEAMEQNTKIYIVCTERPESAAADV